MIDEHTMKWRVSPLFKKNKDANTRYVVNQGGARSSKTFSIIYTLLFKARNEESKCLYSIVRKTMPALRGSAMRDFFEVLEMEGLYRHENHNKSENIYTFCNVEFEFFGLDEPQKVRGRKRKILWLNEANEFTSEDYFQLNLRTTDQVFMDYNPSDEFHWIYDDILTRKDCTFIQSTYKDNPFLAPAIREEIKRLQTEDANKWKIYGLGERGHKEAVIHTNWDLCDDMPEVFDEEFYGLDFGFSSNPAALVHIRVRGQEAWLDELIYQRGLTNLQLCEMMDGMIPVLSYAEMVADSAEPKSIQEIEDYTRKDGGSFNIQPCEKGPDSVAHGINVVNQFKLHITKRSTNLQKEIRSYAWKIDTRRSPDGIGRVLDEPVKFNDHLMNAMRYVLQKRALKEQFSVLWSA